MIINSLTSNAKPLLLEAMRDDMRCELRLTVDGEQMVLTGRCITVDGWTFTRVRDDGNIEGGDLVAASC